MITIKDYEPFAKEFETLYLSRGFGSMNKNELEVLFFHLLKKYGNGFKDKSNFELACALRTSEAKIKRLAYESEMSYGVFGDVEKKDLQTRFLTLLSESKIQKENGTLRFVVEDKFMRSVIYEDLKRSGFYLDTSFNSEIVSIQKEALIALLEMYYSKEEKEEIVSEYKAALQRAKKTVAGTAEEGVTFKHVMGVVFDKCLETGVEKVIEGFGKIDYSQLIKTISGGIRTIGTLIKIVGGIVAFL